MEERKTEERKERTNEWANGSREKNNYSGGPENQNQLNELCSLEETFPIQPN